MGRKPKVVDPKEVRVCGLGIEEISRLAVALKSFHGYTGTETILTSKLKEAVETATKHKISTINAEPSNFPGNKIAKRISARSEVLMATIAWAYRELDLEREYFKSLQEGWKNESIRTTGTSIQPGSLR